MAFFLHALYGVVAGAVLQVMIGWTKVYYPPAVPAVPAKHLAGSDGTAGLLDWCRLLSRESSAVFLAPKFDGTLSRQQWRDPLRDTANAIRTVNRSTTKSLAQNRMSFDPDLAIDLPTAPSRWKW